MLPTDSTGAASARVELSLSPDTHGQWTTPQDFALFTAEFSRDHTDLLVQAEDGSILRLPDYFASDAPADLVTAEGARLTGSVVERLAGPLFPGQYAQSGGFDLADAIGQVETLTGAAFVQRTDGTTVELDIGIKVFQGDVVRTELGGTLSITFADGTIFTLASGSRMVLDELIYDPESTDNSGVFSLVEGSFVFIAGQAAPTGGIDINTPSATMGIRGTTVKVDIQTANGVSTVTVSLNPDFDGGSGAIELFDLEGNLITTITSTDEQWVISPPSTDIPPIRIDRTELDLANDAPLLNQAFEALQTALGRVAQGETFVELPLNETEIQEEQEQPEEEGDAEPTIVPPLDETGDDGEPGESGTDETELNGEDDPLPEEETGPDTEEDAELEDDGATTDTASAGNGAPEVTVTTVQSVEDTTFAGDLGVTDANGDAVSVTLTQGAQNGQVVLVEDGTFTYTPDPDFEGIDSFVVTATDADGAATESEITVVVDPVNDAPVVSAALTAGTTQEIGVNSEGTAPAIGTIGYSDVDEGETPAVWTIAASPENTTALGNISINSATGAWQYDLNQGAADPLAEGEQVIERFVATVTDAEGATDSSTVEVTITGSNDGPVITSGEAQASLEEDVFGFTQEEEGEGEFESLEFEPEDGPATGSVSGTFTFEDVDQGDTPGQWSVAASTANTTQFGDIEIDANTGFWVYTLNQLAADVLGNGDTATEVFAATVTDEFGATASQSITITITGFNDAPTIEFSIEDIEATVFEDGYEGPENEGGEFLRFAPAGFADADASGTLRYVDADGLPGAAASWSISPDGPSFGTMTIDSVTGAWHYILDQDLAQGLTEGEERIETFTATVTDSLGASSSQVITITLIGANDEASVTALPSDLIGAVEEGGIATATGTLTFFDADAAPGDVATWSIAPDGLSRGTMVIDPLSGTWTYTLDEALANALGQGALVTETYTATVTDAQGAQALQTITISITGENDAPQITSAVTTGTLREAGTGDAGIPSISGTLTALDPDQDGTTPVWQIVPDPANGTALGLMMIDGLTGQWTYVLDQGAADALTTGESVLERFTATVEDAFGADRDVIVEITIEGNSDAPVLNAATRTLTEETPSVVVDLSALASDVDDGQDGSTLSYALLNAPAAGSARIEGTDLIFEPGGDFDGLIEGETAQITLNFSATDADGLAETSTVTLTVIGTNGAPVFSDGTAELTEGTPGVAVNLANLADDPDAGEDGTTLLYSISNGPAQGSAGIAGSLLTFTPGSDFDDLAEGAQRQVVIDLIATDADGETATATVTVTVTGTNNIPQILASSVVTGQVDEPLGVNVGPPVVATGTLAYTDPDASTPTSGTWSIVPGSSALGQMTIDPSVGQWIYQLDEAAAQDLNAGDTRTETFTATITDELGATANQQIVITITGTNDAPEIAADSRTVTEEGASVSFDLPALASDIDSADTVGNLAFSILGQPAAGRAEIDGAGTLTFSTDEEFEALAAGDTSTVSIDVEVRDSSGAADVATLTVIVTGTNDGPVITSAVEAARGTVTEAGEGENFPAILNTTPDATGTLTYDDPDETAATPGTWSVEAITADYGALSIDAETGQWKYFLDESLADELREGAIVTEQFTATITDAEGATAQQLIEITITGTNDAPEFDVETSQVTGSHTEGGATTLTGQLIAVDPDIFVGAPSWSILPAAGGFTPLGTMTISGTGTWVYAVDEAAVAALGSGPVITESYVATVTDEFGQSDTITIDIDITGTNTAPVITAEVGETTLDLIEPGDGVPGDISASGQLDYEDVDEGETSGLWSITPDGDTSYGNVSIDPVTGQWTYVLDPAKSDALNAGQQVTETFDAVYTDAFGAASDPQALLVTITGSNDAPNLTAQVVDTDQNTATQIDLVGFAEDVDAEHDATDLVFALTNPVPSGTASITDGVLSFDPDGEFDDLAAGETRDVAINVTTTDPLGATSTSTVTITVTGTNDGPVITSDAGQALGTVVEDGEGEVFPAVAVFVPDATGTLSYSDVDETPTTLGTWTVAPVGPGFGTMQINAQTGEWAYVLNQNTADSLREGTIVDDVFTATVTDAGGLQAQQTIIITITGTNDRPDILSARSDTQAGHTEGGNTTLTGLLEARDPDDFVDAPTWTIVPSGGTVPTFGNMSIDSDGRWTYEVDAVAVAGLPAGATPSEVYTARITDEFGQSDTIDVTIDFVGTNSGPVMGANIGETDRDVTEPGFGEPGLLSVSGQLSYTDEDEGETSGIWSISPEGATTYGTVSINPLTGLWTYVLDPAKSDALNDGQQVTETFDAIYTDAFGAETDPQALVVTITGSNDAPTLTAQTADTDTGSVVEIDLASFADDPDAEHSPEDLSFSITTPVVNGTADILGGSILSFDPAGDFDHLGEGASEEVEITITVEDPLGATSTSTVTVTVTGTNTAPDVVVGGTTTDTVSETEGALTTSGSFDIEDVNLSDTVNVTGISLLASGALGGAGAVDDPALLAMFSTNANPIITDTVTTGTVEWDFDAGLDAFDYLSPGQSLILTYDIEISDDASPAGIVNQTVTITVEGTNDGAVITGDTTGNILGDNTPRTVSGDLDHTDVDATDTDDAWDVGGGTATTTATTFGVAVLHDDGSWTYALDNLDPTVVALGDGQSTTDSFTATTTDGTTQTVTITINGANDAAVISGDTTGDVTEDDVPNTVAGDLNHTDVDDTDTDDAWTAVAPGAATDSGLGTYGLTASGAWTFTLDNLDPTVDALGDGQFTTDSFTATTTDGTTQTVTITINGANDAAVISGDTTGDVTEDDVPNTVAGDLNHTDVDDTDTDDAWDVGGGTFTTTVTTYGQATLHDDGTWTYALDNLDPTVDALGDGQFTTDSFTATTTDGTTQTVTITINGANDAAVISGDTTGDVTEDDVPNTVAGDLNHTDVDDTDTDDAWTAVAPGAATDSGLGTYGLTASGAWTFTLDNLDPTVDALGDGQFATDSFTATTTDGTTQTVTITINGANDAAVITGDTTGDITEDAAPDTVTGDLDHTDVDGDDADDTWNAEGPGPGAVGDNGYGTYQITGSGVWTYTLRNFNGDVDTLAVGDTLQDTFTVATSDGTSQTVTVTINGANDAPIVDVPSSDLTGNMASLDPALPVSGAVTETPTLVRAPIVFGGHPQENIAGIAFDPITGKVYESIGVQRQGETDVRVFNDMADFEAGTVATTITLQSGPSGITDIHGTYFAAYNDVLIGKAYESTTADGRKIAYWDATNGTVLSEDTPIPGVLIIGQPNYGFEWGGFTSINVMQDTTGVYALGKTTGSSWTLARLDPVNQTVVSSETINAGTQGFAFIVEGIVFFGDYQTGNINRAYNIETNTLSVVNISLGVFGGSNDYWSNMAYDAATDTLYMVNSPNSRPLGEIYKIENVSDLVLEPRALPSGTVLFDDVDIGDTHTAAVTFTDANPYLGSLRLGDVEVVGGTQSQVDWDYYISQPDFASLGAGQTTTENFTITITDNNGGTDTETVSITVQGVNDAAVISGDGTGTVAENAIPGQATGNLFHTDVDANNANDVWQAVTTLTATTSMFGFYTVGGSGIWSYLVNNANATVNALNVGDTAQDTFTVLTEDSTTATVTITITGSNDPAIVTGTVAAAIVEDAATDFATGDVNHADVDNDDDVWQEVTPVSNTASDNGYGTYSVTTSGVWTYTLDNTNPAVNALDQGGPILQDTFDLLTEDGTTQQIVIDIAGANDAPTATAAMANITLEPALDVSGPEWNEFNGHYYQFVAGSINWTDARSDAAARGGHLATITSAGEQAFINSLPGPSSVGWLGGSDAAVEGEWRWVDGPEAGQQFWQGDIGGFAVGGAYTNWNGGQPAPGNTAVEHVLHTFSDGTWNDITDFTTLAGYYLEYSGAPLATGTLAGNASDPEPGALTFSQVGNVAGLTINTDGTWSFDQGNAAYDSVGASETVDVIATYRVTDGGSATDTATLTLSLTGANNAAVISGDTTVTIIEDTGPTISRDLSHTDVDNDNADDVWTVVAAGAATDNGYGTFEIDANGQWTYTLDNGNATVNALGPGDPLQDTFTVTTQDGTEQLVTIDIIGANDQPVIVNNAALTLNVQESGASTAGVLSDSATMSVIDPDMTTGGTWSFQTLTTNFFTSVSHDPITGEWGYDLDDGALAVEQLGEGETGEDYFRRTYTDEHGLASATVDMTVIVTGSNDAASIAGALSGTVTEDLGNDSISGDANHTDIDNNNTDDLWQAEPSGSATYGDYSITTGGFWTYTLDDANPTVDALDDGEMLTDSFTITTEDGTTTDVTITINGSTDLPPVVANDDSGFIEDINVLILGTDLTTLTATGNQLNGSNDDRFNFNVSILEIPQAFTPVQWQSQFNSVDVVLLGGNDATGLDGNIMFEELATYHANGGNVVTTGGVVQQLFDTTGATRGFIDDVTPLALQSGGTSIGTSITMNGAVHPITDDIGDITNGFSNWYSSQYVDAGATQLAFPTAGNMIPHSISFTEGSGGVGNKAFVGGAYLDDIGLDTTSLRNGDADFVLEQALAWAAGVNKVDVDENSPFVFTAESLLANDLFGSTAVVTITDVSLVSGLGASVSLLGEDVLYNPTSSATLDDLIDGQTAADTFTYTISDGTNTDTATVTVTVNGISDGFEAIDDNLSPGGVPAVTEDATLTVAHSTLFANDFDPEGLNPSIVGFYEFIPGSFSYFTQSGALLTLTGSDIFVNPLMSAQANDLAASQTLTDSFDYTTLVAGPEYSTATVDYVIQGLAPSADLNPIVNADSGTGFASGDAQQYTVNPLFMQDHDAFTGMSYKFGQISVDGALPDYLKYNTSTRILSVDLNNFTVADAGTTNLFLSGFEGDGDYNVAPFSVILNNTGDIRYTLYGFNDAIGATNLLEYGLDSGLPLGDILAGPVANIDLSGVDATTPFALEDVEILDFQNGQENYWSIDATDLLALIEGNAPTANEQITVEMDAFDEYFFVDDGFLPGQDWNAVEQGSTGVYDLFDTTPGTAGTAGTFGIIGDVFATLTMDGGTEVSS